ncbi:hypothetical protein [Nocardia nova]|uniref:hypothetical protein n=1 Tax=Nocardia nova TaxID=37330 RepID=UPI002738A40B|nr:hypothetical protein [Nocardia nova]
MQQHARGSFVDVLGRRNKFSPGSSDRHMDLDVVGPVARQPVNLVNDDIVDWMLLDVSEHVLKLGSIGGLGALAAFDELLHNDRAERGSLLAVGISLRR